MSDYESAHFGGSDEDEWGVPAQGDPSSANDAMPQVVTSSSAPAHATHSLPNAATPATAPSNEARDDDASSARVTVELTNEQCRIMGALIEKSFLTPDIYPMTTNAIATACNQKTNRDPVVSYTPVLIDSALMELRERNLVRRVHVPGSRSTKHRQTLDEALSLNENELAVLSVLMLRGAQTVGELRLRTERHVDFPDLDATDRCLEGLASRTTPLVRQLARQPGQKEARWLHLIGDETEAPGAPAAAGDSGQPGAAAPVPVQQIPAQQQVESALAERVETLETEVATLRRQLRSLAEQLGESIE